ATLAASTDATSFAVLVTAEPHFLVSAPSAFVVLENRPARQAPGIRYQLLEGVYNFERSSLDDVKPAKGRVHTEVKQAFTAVRLAQRAGDRKSTRLNSSHVSISYAVFCLKKKKNQNESIMYTNNT